MVENEVLDLFDELDRRFRIIDARKRFEKARREQREDQKPESDDLNKGMNTPKKGDLCVHDHPEEPGWKSDSDSKYKDLAKDLHNSSY